MPRYDLFRQSEYDAPQRQAMNTLLTLAIGVTLITSVLIVLRWGNTVCRGSTPTSLFTFCAILFTSGLDVGLLMFPLTEFPVYEQEAPYQFANPLTVEFGMWGFLVWAFYFLTTFYFCRIEPHLKLFELPAVKLVNNGIVIATCAFTGFLFLSYLPTYIEGIAAPARYGLVAAVVCCAVLSSKDVKYVKVLSVASTWLFFALIGVLWVTSGMGAAGFIASASNLGEYFAHVHRFIAPLTDYHAFYLFWWFSWSIMIGQFVSRFLSPMQTWQLLITLLVIPSIPIAIWFSVLYHFHVYSLVLSDALRFCLIGVGIVFVINSLDSLIRLYTVNLNITAETVGGRAYVFGNAAAMFTLIVLYQFTPFKIEWVGLVVIGLYSAIYALLYARRDWLVRLLQAPANVPKP